MSKKRANKIVNVTRDQLLEEHQRLMTEMYELSREMRDCVKEMRKAVSFRTELRGWSKSDPVN